MRYIFVLLFVYACESPQTPAPVVNKSVAPPAIYTHDSSTQSVIDRFYFMLAIMKKRDSFMIGKYQNEALYYKTENEKYRLKANRFIDSTMKYIHIIDSLANKNK